MKKMDDFYVTSKFKLGEEVQSISDPGRIGTVVEVGEVHAGIQWYRLNFGKAGRPKMPETDLRSFVPSKSPFDNLTNRNLDGYQGFQRLMTFQRLSREHPLQNIFYAFNASKTQFYPYQFKPLLKFLNSPKHRLLIADEVGLGKTIEAGIILNEFRARQTLQRVLVVCPANLREKWQMELRRRFDEKFKILTAA
jgi:SNF2 family DNA or RNA helicase